MEQTQLFQTTTICTILDENAAGSSSERVRVSFQFRMLLMQAGELSRRAWGRLSLVGGQCGQ